MSSIKFSISSMDTQTVQSAADALSAILAEGEKSAAIRREDSQALHLDDRKVVDPFAVAGVILAIPGAILAVDDIVDRVRKRRKAQALISTAKQLGSAEKVHVEVIVADGSSRALNQLTADELLEIADKTKETSTLGE